MTVVTFNNNSWHLTHWVYLYLTFGLFRVTIWAAGVTVRFREERYHWQILQAWNIVNTTIQCFKLCGGWKLHPGHTHIPLIVLACIVVFAVHVWTPDDLFVISYMPVPCQCLAVYEVLWCSRAMKFACDFTLDTQLARGSHGYKQDQKEGTSQRRLLGSLQS